MDKVTVCLTSCGRPDLLERTLKSFFEFNTYPIADFLIYEDDPNVYNQGVNNIAEKYEVKLFGDKKNVGQIQAIDRLYGMVDDDCQYIFHLEDDWEFYSSGFIEQSLEVLRSDPKIINVWIRNDLDTNGHPVERVIKNAGSVRYRMMAPVYRSIWHGFTFNPGLRRKSDYDKIGSYSKITAFDPKNPAQSEAAIGRRYFRMGYKAAIIEGAGFVRHIGDNRGIRL